MANEQYYGVDGDTLDLIRAVRSRLNDDRTLQPGEKFDLGRKLDAAISRIEQCVEPMEAQRGN